MKQCKNRPHDTKYKVTHLEHGNFVLFDCLEDAQSYCLNYGYSTPLKLEYPLYQ